MVNQKELQELMAELETESDRELDPMQTRLHQTLQSFDSADFPRNLHGQVMKSIYLRQFRLPLLLINLILAGNFILSAMQLWTLLGVSARLMQLPRVGVNPDTLRALTAAVPMGSAALFGVNLALLVLSLYLLFKMREVL